MRALPAVAFLEATSFIALLVASYVKRQGDGELGVSILGPLHGGLFLLYVILVLTARERAGWSTRTTFWILVGGVLPFGGYVVDWWLARRTAALA